MIKNCSKCNIEKSIDSFHKDRTAKLGIRSACKVCCNVQRKKYTRANKDKIKKYYEENKDKIKKYYEENKDKKKEYDKLYRKKTYKKKRITDKKYYETNKDIINKKNKEYRKANKEKIKANREKYYQANKDKKKEYDKIYNRITRVVIKRNKRMKEKRENDPIYRFIVNQRNRLNKIFINGKYNKSKTTLQYLGCTGKFLNDYIMSKLKDGMTFDNYGIYWEIDHFEPLSPKDRILTKKELEDRLHYKNLRPLTIKENREKGNKELI